jgi:hypothetical protein
MTMRRNRKTQRRMSRRKPTAGRLAKMTREVTASYIDRDTDDLENRQFQRWLKQNRIKYKIIDEEGAGPGIPEVRYTGKREALEQMLDVHFNDGSGDSEWKRMIKGSSASRSLRAEIHALEQRLAVDEAEIDSWGDELAREESAIVDEGTGMNLVENEHQNELAMDNWPSDENNMTASQREMVATKLLKMARYLLSQD